MLHYSEGIVVDLVHESSVGELPPSPIAAPMVLAKRMSHARCSE